jgi:hypothetical protein
LIKLWVIILQYDKLGSEIERDNALAALQLKIKILSTMYKECFLKQGRGGLLLYSGIIIETGMFKVYDYLPKKEIVDFFDDKKSRSTITQMVDSYDPKNEGVLFLATSQSNATYFVTAKLE